jgi:hypothetical protein
MKAMQYLRKLNVPSRYNFDSPTDILTEDEWEYLGKDVAAYVSVFMKNASLGSKKTMCIESGPGPGQTTFLMGIPDPKTKEEVVVGFTIERTSESPSQWKLIDAAALGELSYNYLDIQKKEVQNWLDRSGVAFSVFWTDKNGKKDGLAGYAFDGSHASEKAEYYIPKGCTRKGKVIMSHHPSVPAAISFSYALNRRNGKDTRWDTQEKDNSSEE